MVPLTTFCNAESFVFDKVNTKLSDICVVIVFNRGVDETILVKYEFKILINVLSFNLSKEFIISSNVLADSGVTKP